MLGPRVFKVPSGIINTILSRNAHADRPGNLGALPGFQHLDRVNSVNYVLRATNHAGVAFGDFDAKSG